MRFVFVALLVFSTSTLLAQPDLWRPISAQAPRQALPLASLSNHQKNSIALLLRQQKPETIWECEATEIDDLIKGLRFEWMPDVRQQKVVIAEAPAGCARGAQGANGAMWIIRFDGDKPILLATPEEFSGWLFSVRSTYSHGYPDVVLGWHMSATEANLKYFRFDGKSYRSISTATLKTDDHGSSMIVPQLN
jgi:hypothetical protein